MQLPGTNFCTSSARFAQSFVSNLAAINAPEYYEMHQNVILGSNWEYRVCSLQKISTRLRGANFCISSAHFASSFVRQPNGPECIQIVRNAPKHQFTVQWGGSAEFVAKNSVAASWHELLRRDFMARTSWHEFLH